MASNNLNFDTLKIWGCRGCVQNNDKNLWIMHKPPLFRIPKIIGFCLECHFNLKNCRFEVGQASLNTLYVQQLNLEEIFIWVTSNMQKSISLYYLYSCNQHFWHNIECIIVVYYQVCTIKAEFLQEGIFFLIHLFARDILVMKKLEIKKISPLLLYQF